MPLEQLILRYNEILQAAKDTLLLKYSTIVWRVLKCYRLFFLHGYAEDNEKVITHIIKLEKEKLNIAIEHFYTFISGPRFIFQIDQRPLLAFFKQVTSEGLNNRNVQRIIINFLSHEGDASKVRDLPLAQTNFWWSRASAKWDLYRPRQVAVKWIFLRFVR